MGTVNQMAAQQTQHARRLRRAYPLYLPGMALWFLVGLTISLLPTGKVFADPDFPKPLIEHYQELQPELAQSVFDSPIVLRSNTSKHHAEGEVFAVLDTPIDELQTLLSQPRHWCELAILHINVKACTFRTKKNRQKLTFYVGRQYYQEPSQAFPLEYHFEKLENSNHHLYVNLTSVDGPFGTHDYLISLEAVPIDEQHSFIRFQYRYQFGWWARVAMSTYLATIARHKVGFTVIGTDMEGNPDYIKGMQGVVERNAIRYIYAIQAMLDVSKQPADERQQQGFARWYTLISRHPRQLVEYTREEYYVRKKQELKNQLALQKEVVNE
jgi:hypothetical protein